MATQAQIERDVRHDLKLAKRARVVIRLRGSQDAPEVCIKHNRKSPMQVIAVLGPATSGEQRFSEALLLEIGIGWAHPYHRLYPLRKRMEGPINIPPRRRPFGLTPKQYEHIASILFSTMQALTDETVSRWKSGGYYSFKMGRNYSRTHRKNLTCPRLVVRDVGKKFRVDPRDHLILADLLWASVHHPRIFQSIRKQAGYIGIRLRPTRNAPRRRKEFCETVLFSQLKERAKVTKMTSWQLSAVLDHVRGWERYRVMYDLREHLGTNRDPEALALIRQAQARPETKLRAGRMHLRPFPRNGAYNFELFSSNSGNPSERFAAPEPVEKTLQEVPF
jgi:hypothetical protein